ncbi:hypothetical protein [Hyphomicrobium sp. 1Nfss2.1]|uniref:hypothetical protein n=1 Tax=Hyphomicrobium sp. 1Nfss2.1 TaxID=3413936 RepID=UPI003C7DC80D
MHRAVFAACALALGSAATISTATALPVAKRAPGSEPVVQTVAQKKIAEDEGQRTSKSKSKRTSGQDKSADDKSKQSATRFGSIAPGVSVPLTVRGSHLYSPSFNGVYTPPAGYSSRGYPIRYADEVASSQSECAALRRNALSSGKRAAWDRYHACSKAKD